jgi:hypothetical protein
MEESRVSAGPAIEKLLRAEEDQLYEQLGMRLRAISKDPAVAGSFQPVLMPDIEIMGTLDDLREVGQRLFQRWSREAHSLVCGMNNSSDTDRRQLLAAFGMGEVTAGAALSAELVTHLGLAPALAAVIAALLVKRFFRPAYEEFCQLWLERLPRTSAGG